MFWGMSIEHIFSGAWLAPAEFMPLWFVVSEHLEIMPPNPVILSTCPNICHPQHLRVLCSPFWSGAVAQGGSELAHVQTRCDDIDRKKFVDTFLAQLYKLEPMQILIVSQRRLMVFDALLLDCEGILCPCTISSHRANKSRAAVYVSGTSRHQLLHPGAWGRMRQWTPLLNFSSLSSLGWHLSIPYNEAPTYNLD